MTPKFHQTGKARLIACLRAAIEKEGKISFCRFMKEALYHPKHGYYASAKIGREGDFYTNVSVGNLFGSLMARQFFEMWQVLGEPKTFDICEQGAHNGQFAADVLQFLHDNHPQCFRACRYVIIESLSALKQKQKEFLECAKLSKKIRWIDSLSKIKKESLEGVFFSNELLDSFPVCLVTFSQGKWHEKFVIWKNNEFQFILRPIQNLGLKKAIPHLPAIEGYETEICLSIRGWVQQVARILRRGFVLTMDYGLLHDELYSCERSKGTLRCYHQHKASDNPLAHIGEQDITAHVNFSDLMEAGDKAGLQTLAFTDQHHFLIGLAENSAFQNLDAKSLRAFRALMHPEMMGTTFKVLLQQKGLKDSPPLSGTKYARAF